MNFCKSVHTQKTLRMGSGTNEELNKGANGRCEECVCCVPVPVCAGGGLVTKSCSTLCDPRDCSPPGYILSRGFSMGFSVHGILQARILEWIAISFSRGSSRPRD